MELTLQEKLKLINFFEFLLDGEISKPLGKMNSEAVDNYIKILLNLQNKRVELSSEFINEQVSKIFHTEEIAAPETAKTTKKRYSKNKIWLVAACITILVALFSVLSFSSERSVVNVLEDFFGAFEFIPFGKEVDVGDESYGKIGDSKVYKSIKDLAEKEKINILYSKIIKDSVMIIGVDKTVDSGTIDISHTDNNISVTITLNSEIQQETLDFCNDKVTLNGIDYYLCIMEDVNQAQAYFVYDNNMYRIIHTNKNALIEILNNMEEIKYED